MPIIQPRVTSKKLQAKTAGQAMLILVLILGATMLGVTAIAGYVSLQKLKASTDIRDSTVAIYAADSGVEWCFYTKFSPNGSSTNSCNTTNIPFNNGASVSVIDNGTVVKSIGQMGNSFRAFGIFLGQFNP